MFRGGLSKRPAILALALLLAVVPWVASACGARNSSVTTAVLPKAAVQTTGTHLTTTTVIPAGETSPESAGPRVSDPDTRKLLDQVREAARLSPFTVYYLGASYRNAMIAGVMAGGTDSSGTPRLVDMVYRHDSWGDRLVVYVSQYDPGSKPDLKKPLPGWTLIREVSTNGHADAIYRGGESTDPVFYVAQRGSTEICLGGYTSEGYMTVEQLIDIAPHLVPAL